MSTEPTRTGTLKTKGELFGIWNEHLCQLIGNTLYIKSKVAPNLVEQQIEIDQNTLVQVQPNERPPLILIETHLSPPLIFAGQNANDVNGWAFDICACTYNDNQLSMADFEIISVVGRGHYGKVMLVQAKKTRAFYAIKTIHKSRLVKGRTISSIMRERTILAKCDSPFIVHLCFAFQTDSKFYLGLEYIPGGDLFSRISSPEPINIGDIRIYIAEIALALYYLHNIGIVYRDLKPENILIDITGHLKLTDFGLSKDLGGENSSGSIAGTSEYMAPELFHGERASFANDWWSLGIVAFELLYKQTPFHHTVPGQVFNGILHEEPDFPEDADPLFADFVKRLLEKDPRRRAGFNEVARHQFFAGINFSDVNERLLCTSYLPDVTDYSSAFNFDSAFRNERAYDSLATPVHDSFSQLLDIPWSTNEIISHAA